MPRTDVSLIDCSAYFTLPVSLRTNRTNIFAAPAARRYSLIVLHVEVFALFALQVVIHVGDGGGNFEDEENIRAQVEDLLRHVIVDAGDEGDHSDHGSHSDHYAE